MKTVEKRSLTKTQRLAIILSSVLVLLIVGSIVLSIVYARIINDEPEQTLPDIRPELGESLYGGHPVAYERLEESEILSLFVTNDKGKFDLTRWPDENGVFWLGYDDGSGKSTTYIPAIVDAENGFDYESLYAIEQNDGYGRMYMLSYLCSAVGTPYFTERIDLPEDEEVRAALLAEYGLEGEDASPTTVSFVYGYRDEENKLTDEGGEYHIQIGSPALNGDGRYYRVLGRDCVYYTQYNTFKYAELGFESFVKGTLVAAGLADDKSFEPLLTTEFTEWKNTMHDGEDDRVAAGSSVISVGNVREPVKEGSLYKPQDYADGYKHTEKSELKFDLSALKDHGDFERIEAALIGKAPGKQTNLYLTLISELYSTSDMIIDLGESGSVTYKYAITAIESILDADGGKTEVVTEGVTVGGASLIRVSYDCYIGSEKQNTVPRHAVLDLTSPLISASALSALRAASIGSLASAIELEITYTAENALSSHEELIISDILGIYAEDGSAVKTVAADSYVSIKYYERIDGVAGDKKSTTVSMSDVKDDAKWAGLYSALLGKEIGKDVNVSAYDDVYYHEIMRSFVCYEITDIECYVTSEEIVSFSFVNESVRDPFFGESVYENDTGSYSLYGIDADVCQNVLRIMGGLSDDTTASSGLAGTTIAVGLTHEVMKENNLYDYTIYFELPRIIDTEVIPADDEDEESMEDYYWDHTLGFTLYVSRPFPDGTRRVGSDMYDVVASVSADTFEFLDYSFVDFWARRSMIMVELGNVDSFKLDFFMDDVKGSYDFEIIKDKVYVHPTYGDPSYTPYEGAVEQDFFTVYVTESGDVMTDTELHKFSEQIGSDRVALHALYNEVMGGGEHLTLPGSIEWVGVSNFMLAFQLMQMTPYQGALTDAEKANASEDNKLMSITLGLKGRNASANDYVYEFYRVTDRKVMVRTYTINASGDMVDRNHNGVEDDYVNDFYISTYSFKKMVNAYLSVFNAKSVNGDIPYVDELAD